MAKRSISEIERGVGFIAGLIPALMDIARELEVPFEAVYRLVTAEGRATLVKMVQVAHQDWLASQTVAVEPGPAILQYDLTVDYGKTIEQMIKMDEYDGYVDPNITTRNYPIVGRGVVQRKALLVHFGKNMSDEAFNAWCTANNKVRATALEILAFGAAYKLLQCEFPIVSGQTAQIRGNRYVVCLYRHDGRRDVGLSWTGHEWSGICRFLVFDKE